MVVQYSETQAIQVASELTRLDLDGWTYRPEPVESQDLAVVAVYDEHQDFVAYLDLYLVPTEVEHLVVASCQCISPHYKHQVCSSV